MRSDAPLPGDFGLVATNGWKAALIRKVTRSPVNHAVLYLGNAQIIEGDPAGALISPVSKYTAVAWSDIALTEAQRISIVRHGYSHKGAPYSWLDCLAIGLADTFGHKLPGPLRRFLSRKDRLMCSQLVDVSYTEAGVHLFADGRLPSDVAPGDLYDLITA